jgi:hypothetical protein
MKVSINWRERGKERIPGTGSVLSTTAGSPTLRPLLPVKRCMRLGLVLVNVDWKY